MGELKGQLEEASAAIISGFEELVEMAPRAVTIIFRPV